MNRNGAYKPERTMPLAFASDSADNRDADAFRSMLGVQMTDSNDLVRLTTAQSVFEAHMICGILADHGIPGHVPGENAMDEWGAAQRSMAVRVEVPESRLEEAKKILAEKKAEIAAGKHKLEDDADVSE